MTMKPGQIYDGFIPGRHLIDSYGDGGFRFAGMSHRGSILILPSGIHAWKREEGRKPDPTSLERDFSCIIDDIRKEAEQIDLLLIGTGDNVVLPSVGLREILEESRIRFDVMQTGSALRTYNVLFEEQRRIAAAVLAVTN